MRRLGDGGGQVQEHRVAGLHVGSAAAPEFVAVEAARQVVRRRNRVGVPGQQHARQPAQVGPGQHGVAVADHLEMRGLGLERGLDLVGDELFVPRFTGNVDQRGGQSDRVGGEIQHPARLVGRPVQATARKARMAGAVEAPSSVERSAG